MIEKKHVFDSVRSPQSRSRCIKYQESGDAVLERSRENENGDSEYLWRVHALMIAAQVSTLPLNSTFEKCFRKTDKTDLAPTQPARLAVSLVNTLEVAVAPYQSIFLSN